MDQAPQDATGAAMNGSDTSGVDTFDDDDYPA
jgi:hypothetical protein